MRLLAFALALLMLSGAVEASTGWLAVIVILAGISAFHLRPWRLFMPRPALDVRMASFVLAVLLLFGVVEPTRDWLIALSAVTGVAAFMPGIISSMEHEHTPMRWHRARRIDWRWDGDWR